MLDTTRIRQDFSAERDKCIRMHRCLLPNDCPACQRFVCNACERMVSWEQGCSGDMEGLCDECWARFENGWSDGA